MHKHIQAIVLAGGRSSRLKTGKNKLTERICGQEIILYATTLLERLQIKTNVLVGFEKETIEKIVSQKHGTSISFIEQKEQNGTGHAVQCTKDAWTKDHILVLNGDMPLITDTTISNLIEKHCTSNAAVTFVTAHNNDPATSYGRVIEKDGSIEIIEAKDFDGDAYEQCCINAGVYIFKTTFLRKAIDQLQPSKATKEWYITDLVGLASEQKLTIKTVHVPFDEVRGVNTMRELWTAEQIKRSELINYWMERGVRFHAAQSTHLDIDITIGAGSYIGCGVHLMKGSSIGKQCHIECFSTIQSSKIADHVTIYSNSIISDSRIEPYCKIGPFAHIETSSEIGEHCVIGNFVQIKRSKLGSNNKAKHHAYLGDAIIGNNNNIGAGTITCNYDGTTKHTTIIQNNCFIGSNNTIVPPVTIESNSYTAAGSTITQDVPSKALAIGRSRQINKEEYVQRLKEKTEAKKTVFPSEDVEVTDNCDML